MMFCASGRVRRGTYVASSFKERTFGLEVAFAVHLQLDVFVQAFAQDIVQFIIVNNEAGQGNFEHVYGIRLYAVKNVFQGEIHVPVGRGSGGV